MDSYRSWGKALVPVVALLFNIYAEKMMREAREKLGVGIQEGLLMKKAIFADDQTLVW